MRSWSKKNRRGSHPVSRSSSNPAEGMVRGSGWRELAIQVGLVGFAVLMYFVVRGQTEGAESAALQNGAWVLEWEERLGLAFEQDLQSVVAPSQTATTLSNWAYIWLHWPVIIVTLLWLHRARRLDYLVLRNAMFVSGAIGLMIFIRFPVAPPRLLPGFIDTVTNFSTSYRVLQPPNLVNKYAAVPSLHVGWNLLVGYALYRATRNRAVRAFAVLSPAVMIFAVVATANHYIVDAVAGAIVALAGLFIAQRITPWLAVRTGRLLFRDQFQVVEDHTGDSKPLHAGDGFDVLNRPGEEQASSQEVADHSIGQQAAMYHSPIDLRPHRNQGKQQEKGQLEAIPR